MSHVDPLTAPIHLAAIALGSNLGDSLATVEAALDILETTAGITLKARSPWYKTAPIGPPQPDYINGCALLITTLTAPQLLKVLLQTEAKFGRVRRERWAARTLDLDLLLYADQVIDTPDLQVPHPRMGDRAFVLIPLAAIAPDWRHPVLGKTVAQLSQAIEPSGVKPL